MAQAIRVGVAGMGFGAQVHLPALHGIEGVRVAALADSGSGRAGVVADTLGLSPEIYSDGRTMARDAAVDLIVVATPPVHQAAVVLEAIAAGKAVFCEKPFGASLQEAREMTERAEAAGCRNAVGFQFRYDRGISCLLDAVATGVAGRVHRIEVAWLTSGGLAADRPWCWRHDGAQGGGVLPEFCSHVLDYLALLAGSPVTGVTMHAETAVERRPAGGGMRPVSAHDRIEMLVALGGVTAHVSVSNIERLPLGHSVVVHGDAGRLTFTHRPPFGPKDLNVRAETVEVKGDLPLPAVPAANGDSRLAATQNLLAALLGEMAGTPAPRLPDFRSGLAVRRAIAMAEASTSL